MALGGSVAIQQFVPEVSVCVAGARKQSTAWPMRFGMITCRYVLAMTTHSGRTQSARAPLELERFEILDSTGVAGLASIMGGG